MRDETKRGLAQGSRHGGTRPPATSSKQFARILTEQSIYMLNQFDMMSSHIAYRARNNTHNTLFELGRASICTFASFPNHIYYIMRPSGVSGNTNTNTLASAPHRSFECISGSRKHARVQNARCDRECDSVLVSVSGSVSRSQ